MCIIKHFLLIILYLILQPIILLAQIDSSKAELGLDFFIGRIVGGPGAGIEYYQSRDHFNMENYFNESYESYRPVLMLSKGNFISVNLSDYSYRPTYDKYKNWSHYPEIQIKYRPQKSIQFYLANKYQFIDRDFQRTIDSTTFRSSLDINKNRAVDFGIQFLSQDGNTGYNKDMSKWLYYLMSKQISMTSEDTYSTYNLIQKRLETLPIIFLNSNQIYLELIGRYDYYKEKRTQIRETYKTTLGPFNKNESYRSAQNNMYGFYAHYNLLNKLYLAQKFGYYNWSNFNDYISDISYNNEQEIKYSGGTRNYDVNRLSYQINVNFLTHKNVLNQLCYSIDKIELGQYSKSFNNIDSVSIYHYEIDQKDILHNFGYVFNFLKVNNSIPLLNILSNYDNYYGHLLPRGAIKWTSAVFLKDWKSQNVYQKSKYEYEIAEYYRYTGQSLGCKQNFSYGITNNINLSLTMLIEHQTSGNSHSFGNFYQIMYFNMTEFSSQLCLSFYNYHFDESQVNWVTLSNFNYWQGPLLNNGMLRIELNYILPEYGYGWHSNEKKLFEFKLNKLRSSKVNTLVMRLAYGLPKNLEFDLVTSLSWYGLERWRRTPYIPREESNFSSETTLKWQFLNNARISVNYFIRYPYLKKTDKYNHEFNIGLAALF